MAEGGDFTRSIEDGSDFVFEFECSPCAADGSRFEALQFCQTCNQFLCDTCTKYHKRFTKSHQLAPAGSTKHQKSSKTTVDVPKCRIHPDRDIEMYCGTHDMVYCLLCIAKEHRSCGGVEEVQNGVHKTNASTLQQLVADIDRANKELHETKCEKSRNVPMLKTKKVHLLKEIDNLRKEMNDHLDHLERKIKTELDEELAKSEQEIRDDIAAADDLLTTTNKRKADLACNFDDDKTLFIAEKLGQYDVSAANEFLAKANLSKQNVFKFERNTRLYDCIKGTDNLGRIVTNSSTPQVAKRSKYVVKSSSERNVEVNTDTGKCCIGGMCQHQDGTILMIDYNNRKLKRLDDQLNVKDHCNLKSKPSGLCSISPTEVVVRYRHSMQFIHVGESLSPGKKVNIKQLGESYSNHITLCDNKLWTTGEECIHVYSTSGKLLKTIDRDSQGQQIFEMDLLGIAVHNDGSKVYVTTQGNSVVVFNKKGDVIQELRDQRLNNSFGICITEDDIVLVTGWYS